METKQLELRSVNLDYEHNAAASERGLHGFPEIAKLKVYPKSAKVAITYDPAVTKPETLGFPAQKRMEMAEMPTE